MSQHDIVIIGGGPGGYVAAIRAAQLGLNTACVEMDTRLGGTCVRVGCIPSKALLESSERYEEAKEHLGDFGVTVGDVGFDLAKMMARKDSIVAGLTNGVDFLFKKNKITRYLGKGKILAPGKVEVSGPDGQKTEITTKNIVIATGSVVAQLKGVELDGDKIGTSTEALSYPEVPKHLVLIGAGYIGLEMGSVWRRLGAKVTVVEYLDRILPGMDGEIAKEALKLFKKQGFDFRLGSKVTSARRNGDGCIVEIEGQESIQCDRVLLAAGRWPTTEGLGLAEVGVETDRRGFVVVDGHYRTNVRDIYAIGDVIGGAMLAHKAEEEGVACVEGIVTGYGHLNYNAIPGVVYTHPEIATVGSTEEQLSERGVNFKKGVFPFSVNGRARALNQTDGKVKILADAKTDRILGVHIIGPRAGDLISEAVAAIEFGASSEDLARTCHAHPTLSEAVREAALGVDGRIRQM
ncbi:MAG TPA: dihydrolipoyl dehydrogenase [Polyangiaceae bacterium]|nr:dihydrolipoyl dehydrogenase [Polyangiaceae bacterium]